MKSHNSSLLFAVLAASAVFALPTHMRRADQVLNEGGNVVQCLPGTVLDPFAGQIDHGACMCTDPNRMIQQYVSLSTNTATYECGQCITAQNVNNNAAVTPNAATGLCNPCPLANSELVLIDAVHWVHECHCIAGYEGDGVTSCSPSTAAPTCTGTGRVLNAAGTACVCDQGFFGDGRSCTPIPTCTGDGQQMNPADTACFCKDGFTGNGDICTAVSGGGSSGSGGSGGSGGDGGKGHGKGKGGFSGQGSYHNGDGNTAGDNYGSSTGSSTEDSGYSSGSSSADYGHYSGSYDSGYPSPSGNNDSGSSDRGYSGPTGKNHRHTSGSGLYSSGYPSTSGDDYSSSSSKNYPSKGNSGANNGDYTSQSSSGSGYSHNGASGSSSYPPSLTCSSGSYASSGSCVCTCQNSRFDVSSNGCVCKFGYEKGGGGNCNNVTAAKGYTYN